MKVKHIDHIGVAVKSIEQAGLMPIPRPMSRLSNGWIYWSPTNWP